MNTMTNIIATTYTRDQVKKATIEYFGGDEMAADNWINKYAIHKDQDEYLELTPEDMHIRMAREFARIEKKYDKWLDEEDYLNLTSIGKAFVGVTEDKILELFKNFKYIIPQGSVMSVLGNDQIIGSLSNCVVIPDVIDSYGGICYTDQQLAQLFKRRCGVGVDLSRLRPKKEYVSNAAGTTTGSVSFMHRFSRTAEEVGQNGRRGALMLTMCVAHPDIEEFITIKQDCTSVTGANISVRLTDEFMNAVEADEEYILRWPVDCKPEDAEVTRSVNAKELWNKIVYSARNFAEPGLIFWDKHHHYSTSSIYPGFENASTNPCGEIAMQGGDSCRLIAINLYSFVDNPFTEKASFNFEKFYEVTYIAQKLNDDLVDLELERIDQILEKIESDPEPKNVKQIEIDTWKLLQHYGKRGRRTGLGFTAMGDMIAAMGMKYDSDDAVEFVESVMKSKCDAEFNSSIDMAISRGRFIDFLEEYENKSEFVKMLREELPEVAKRMEQFGRRNISISTCAPTGTVSSLTRTSSGIEPVYALSMIRKRRINYTECDADQVDFTDEKGEKWQEYELDHPQLAKWKEVTGKTEIEDSPYAGSTAEEIEWENRVRLQGVVQKYTTHSISSTINLSSDVSEEVVGKIYMKAWKEGLKGVTVYRDGSRQGIITKSKMDELLDKIQPSNAPKRPQILPCDIHYSTIQGSQWIFFVGLLHGSPYEIFGGCREEVSIPFKYKTAFIKKNSRDDKGRRKYNLFLDDPTSYDEESRQKPKPHIKDLGGEFEPAEAFHTRFISVSLRHGVPIQFICEQLNKTTPTNMNSFEKGIARVLKKYINNGAVGSIKCSQCGSKLTYLEGCVKCLTCGESYCQ